MSIGFIVLLPMIFWVFVVMLIIAVSKPRRRPTQTGRGSSPGQRYPAGTQTKSSFSKPRTTVKTSGQRPKMQEGLFDMNLGQKTAGGKKQPAKSWRNSDFDDYSTIGRKKDFVSGYDRTLSKGSYKARRSADRQYAHTYDGHEPWDKCLPKEKDPWDKDFYA